jgi:diadenosine tetraphosphate (Ap4A) HIT family hydrolase
LVFRLGHEAALKADTTCAKLEIAIKSQRPLEHRKCLYCPMIKDVRRAVTKVYPGEWDDQFLVMDAIESSAEGHILVIPREHGQDARASPGLLGRTMDCAQQVADELYPEMKVMFSTSKGLWAGQTVPHLHVEILPGAEFDLPWAGQRPDHYNTPGQEPYPEAEKPKFPAKAQARIGTGTI